MNQCMCGSLGLLHVFGTVVPTMDSVCGWCGDRSPVLVDATHDEAHVYKVCGPCLAGLWGMARHVVVVPNPNLVKSSGRTAPVNAADNQLVVLIEKVFEEDQTDEYFDLTETFLERIIRMAWAGGVNVGAYDFPNTFKSLHKCVKASGGALSRRGYSVVISVIHDKRAKKKGCSHVHIKRGEMNHAR